MKRKKGRYNMKSDKKKMEDERKVKEKQGRKSKVENTRKGLLSGELSAG